MEAHKRVPLRTEADLRTHAVSILHRINADERGGLLFLLNPVYALEEAGYELSADMRRHLLRGLRYGAKTKARIRALETEVADHAGRPVNVQSDTQVSRLLFGELKLPGPETTRPAPPLQATASAPYDPDLDEPDAQPPDGTPATLTPEMLEALRGSHPVVPRIIELRGLLRGGWRFVDRETFERVKSGASVTLLRGVRFRADRKKAFLNSLRQGEP